MEVVVDFVNSMEREEVINHPLLIFNEDITNYLKTDEADKFDIFILFSVLVSKLLDYTENEGDNLLGYQNGIIKRLEEIYKMLEPDFDVFRDIISYEGTDIFMIEMILLSLLEDFYKNIIFLELLEYILDSKDEIENHDEILTIVKRIIIENLLDDYKVFTCLIENENWYLMIEIIDEMISNNNEFINLINEWGCETFIDNYEYDCDNLTEKEED